MHVIAINGSPRKKWNTATLLENALEGAESQGAETELINLYDLNFKGCKSCFSCKIKGSKSYGKCAINDDLTDVFRKIEESDALILGSPIYFGTATGEMRSFMERFMFQYNVYTDPIQSLFPKKINIGSIYTMNATEAQMRDHGFDQPIIFTESILKWIFGNSKTLISFDTYQFKDYSKVVADRFDPEHKAKVRKEVFPKDCENAFEMGARFAQRG
jgi:multimeric flavodoxin WrbA